MNKWIRILLVCVTFLLAPFTQAFADNSPLGYWKTVDDVTGKPKSILHIYSESDGSLSGQVVKIFPRPGFDQNEVCTACKGSLQNQRIVGMVVMKNLKQSASNPLQWSGGSILDPLNGKTYRCAITLIDGGNRLNVRGYVGISLFGRTQTWLRQSR